MLVGVCFVVPSVFVLMTMPVLMGMRVLNITVLMFMVMLMLVSVLVLLGCHTFLHFKGSKPRTLIRCDNAFVSGAEFDPLVRADGASGHSALPARCARNRNSATLE